MFNSLATTSGICSKKPGVHIINPQKLATCNLISKIDFETLFFFYLWHGLCLQCLPIPGSTYCTSEPSLSEQHRAAACLARCPVRGLLCFAGIRLTIPRQHLEILVRYLPKHALTLQLHCCNGTIEKAAEPEVGCWTASAVSITIIWMMTYGYIFI